MKKLQLLSIGILLAGVALIVGCNPPATDVTKEIVEANAKFMEAFNAADAAGVAAVYTVDAKLFPPNSNIVEGQKAIMEFWNGAIQMGVETAKLETIIAKSYGNFALEEGFYKLFGPENVLIDQGKYMVAWNKIDGQWRINRDIWNTSTKHVAREN